MPPMKAKDPVQRMKYRREEMASYHRDYRRAKAAGRIPEAAALKAKVSRLASNLRRLGKVEANRRRARAAANPVASDRARQSASAFREMAAGAQREANRRGPSAGRYYQEIADEYLRFAAKWDRVAAGHIVSFAGGEAG